MKRNRKILITAHCILNQNSVLPDWERAKGPFSSLVEVVLKKDIGLIQLPCPELLFAGLQRSPQSKDGYNTKAFRDLSRTLLAPYLKQICLYQEGGYDLIGILGISESPSCDTQGQVGVFMEVFLEMMKEKNIRLETFDLPSDYVEGKAHPCLKDFENFLGVSI